jgi:uncharacterized protein (TIGR02246 family)
MIQRNKIYLKAAVVLSLLVVFSLAASRAKPQSDASSGSSDDVAAIRQAVAQYADAMNRHDGHAAAMSFAEDADYTDAAGIAFHGRKGIDEGFTSMFLDRLRTAHWDVSVRSVRFLSPTIASVDNDWKSTGSKNPDGSPRPVHTGVHTWIMTKQNGRWLITIFHNQANIS